jgi:hypothetical protein
MGAQIEIKTELFVAKCALKWLFTCVNQLVTLEFRVVKEPFITAIHRANILPFAMRHHMLTQTG